MKQLSQWAFRWPLSAKIIIAFLQILVFILMVWLAAILQAIEFFLPIWMFYLAISSVIAGYAFIYSAKIKTKRRFIGTYFRKKCLDFVIISMSFLAVLVAFNRNMTMFNVQQGVNASNIVEVPVNKTEPVSRKAWRKEVRDQFRIIKKEIKSNQQKGQGGKIALIIVAGVLLILLLAALSCAIACEGPVVLGIFLFIAGGFAIIYGMVRWIRKIKSKS